MAHSWGHRSPWVLPRCPAWRSPWMCSSAPFAAESEKSPKCSRVKQSPRGSSYIVPGARGRPGAQSSPARTSGAARRPRRCVARPRLSRGLARAWRAQGRSLLTLGRLDVSLAADPGGPVELRQHDARGGERGVQSPETRFRFRFRLSFPGCVSCCWDLVSSLAG